MKKHTSGVYSITNTKTGQIYIGSSCHVYGRWAQHKHKLRKGTHHSPRLQRAWQIDGAECFVFNVLESEVEKENLFKTEQAWIEKTDCFARKGGYNMQPNAGGPRGWKASAQTRELMSKQRKGRKLGPCSEEHRAKISQSKKGNGLGRKSAPFTQEHRANISAWQKGRTLPDATRSKLSKARKGKPLSPCACSKTSRYFSYPKSQP